MAEGTVEEQHAALARRVEALEVALHEAGEKVTDLQERLDLQIERNDELSRELERYQNAGRLVHPSLEGVFARRV